MIDLMLKCSSCKEYKKSNEFYKQSSSSRGFAYRCKICDKKLRDLAYLEKTPEQKASKIKYQREHRQKNKLKYREHWLKYNYNIDLKIYNKMLENQDFKCLICKSDDPGHSKGNFSIDHDHLCCQGNRSCGKCIRGLLCSYCNHGLGSFKDSIEYLKSAVEYLEKGSIDHD